jgi:hypothetical protein
VKRKRNTTHFRSKITAWRGYDGCELPDGRMGTIMAQGWLDENGAFYEMPEGGFVKVQDLDRGVSPLYIYAPIAKVRMHAFSFYVSLR